MAKIVISLELEFEESFRVLVARQFIPSDIVAAARHYQAAGL